MVHSQSDHIPGNKYNGCGDSHHFPGCVERLLRERELSSKGPHLNKSSGINNHGGLFRQRLLVVANGLPVSAVRTSEDSWSMEMSAGGLVSGLLGVKEIEAIWIGWAGVNVPDEIGQKTLTKALAEKFSHL